MQRKATTVLIVEDSALMRRALTEIINSDPGLRVVGAAVDGEDGVEKARRLCPDVVTLDVNLPGMDGITCLQHIMAESPRPCVMVSAYTGKDAVETFEALDLGAVDFVEKPSGEISRDIDSRAREIIRKVKGAAAANLMAVTRRRPARPTERTAHPSPLPPPAVPDRVVVIGVSTGGPRTLLQIIPALPPDLKAPVLVVQHMPGRFTTGFAARLDAASALPVKEAQNGEALRDGSVYLAPGDFHMALVRQGETVRVCLDRPAEEDLYTPSVECTLHSAIDTFETRAIGVILTGMGSDGAEAMARLHALGGETLAESEQTAVIYGMPREVILRGAAKVVAPADEMAAKIVEAVKKQARDS